jgi:hypothetical protein
LCSVVLFFAALFSKQNTITMAPALVLFDWIVRRRRFEIRWAWVRPYVPYVVLTVVFLALRYVVFHEVARESLLSAQRVREFLSDSSRHLARLVFGGPGIRYWSLRDTSVVALGVVIVGAIAWRLSRSGTHALWRPAIYFGRDLGRPGHPADPHVRLLLAEAHVSSVARLGGDRGHRTGNHLAAQTHTGPSSDWCRCGRSARDRICRAAPRRCPRVEWLRRDFSRRRRTTWTRGGDRSRGTLVIAGVPRSSWAFAVPHSVRAPFTSNDVSKRLLIISDSFDHCCDAPQWERYTRDALHRWNDEAASGRGGVVLGCANGRMSRVSDRDDPQLRTLASLLIETRDRASLDSQIQGLLRDYVALR